MKWVFWGAAALIAYTYAGLSAAGCGCAAGCVRVPVQRGRYSRQVSVVMVVRNEEQALEAQAARICCTWTIRRNCSRSS